jgi:ATP-binding cassette subfamily C protein CydC
VSDVSGHPLARTMRLAGAHRGRLALAMLLGALAISASVGLMATSGYLISRAAQHPPILELGVAIVGVRFFGVSRGVFRYLERLASHDAALRAIATLRSRLFARLEPLVPGGLPTIRTGDLLGRFVADIDALQNLYLRAVGPIVIAAFAGSIAVGVGMVTLPVAGLVLAAFLLLAGLLLPCLGTALTRAAARREAPARAALTAELLDALESAPELVAFGAAGAAAARIATADRALARHRRRSALVAAAGEGGMTALAGLVVVAIIAVATPHVRDHTLGGVELAMLALLALAAFEAVRPLPIAAEQLVLTSEAARRVLDLTDREPPVEDPDSPRPFTGDGRIDVCGVGLRYDPSGTAVLEQLDLELPPGEVVVLHGPSGCGKTSLANLLVRFRDPDEGAILLDGFDLREYAQADVHRAVGLAGQDAHLFPTSIRENLRIARPGATDAELADALRRAHAWEFVSELPEGLGTYVGENGARVSGGQRQRIALARALLADVRLLVVDEPDAHLDDETADCVIADVIAAARASRMGVLLITHRPVASSLIDRLVELRDGRICSSNQGSRPTAPAAGLYSAVSR